MIKTLLISMPSCGKTTLVREINSAKAHFSSTAVDFDCSGFRTTETDSRIGATKFICSLLFEPYSRYEVVTAPTGTVDWRLFKDEANPIGLRVVFCIPDNDYADTIIARIKARDGETLFSQRYAELIHDWILNARVEFNVAKQLGINASWVSINDEKPYVSDVYQALGDNPLLIEHEIKVESKLLWSLMADKINEAYNNGGNFSGYLNCAEDYYDSALKCHWGQYSIFDSVESLLPFHDERDFTSHYQTIVAKAAILSLCTQTSFITLLEFYSHEDWRFEDSHLPCFQRGEKR